MRKKRLIAIRIVLRRKFQNYNRKNHLQIEQEFWDLVTKLHQFTEKYNHQGRRQKIIVRICVVKNNN